MERRGWSPALSLRIAVVLLPMTCSAVPVARAADIFGGSLGVTSDYVYRGISHSDGEWAAQGGAHVRFDGWQLGAWASTLEHRHDDDAVQLDGFLGYGYAITPAWRMHTQYTHTAYLDDRSPLGYDYDELALSISYQSQASLSVTWIPNAARYRYWGTQRENAYAYDASWLQPVWRSWHLSLGAGYYDVSALYGFGYAYWHTGLVGKAGPFDAEVLYIDSQDRAAYVAYSGYYDLAGERWSASLRWRF